MKKLFLFIYLFVLVILTGQTAYAGSSNSSSPSEKIQYDLAYPGMLPDHPLYKLKVLRDKISINLINDPLKKADFYLLQTDKGILSSAILVDKNKLKLAEETLLKAENNFTLLTYELKKLDKKPSAQLVKKLKTASLKHQEVISSLIKRVPKENKKIFETVLNFSKTNLQTVERLQKKIFYTQQ